MGKIGRPGLADGPRLRVWELWKQGISYSEISRIIGVPPGSVFSILKPRGGIYFPPPEARPGSLSLAEREEVSRGIAAEESVRAIATKLGRAPSTISREINNNGGRGKYRAMAAEHRAIRRRRRPQKLKLEGNPVLRNYVRTRLKKFWSPEQIAGRLKRDYPNNQRMWISHEAIYRSVYLNSARKVLPARIHQCLRRRRPLRHGQHHTVSGQWRSQIKDARPIADRPAQAEERSEVGHWEGDLLLGTRISQVATLVDRCTRKTAIVKLPDRTAENTRIHLGQYIHDNPDLAIKTITWDRGMELAEHQRLSKATGVEVFFADARSPWQRGTNENTNGLLRQYFPKKTNLDTYSQQDFDDIATELNNRPRKTLGFRTPLEAELDSVALTV